MRIVIGVLVLFMLFVVVGPDDASADVRIGVRSGNSFLAIGDRGIRGRLAIGQHKAKRGRLPHRTKPHRRPYHARPSRSRVLYLPIYRNERRSAPPEPIPPIPARPPSVQAEKIAAAPLDPAGESRLQRARGQIGPRFEIGQTLPPSQPHVTLDPVRYGLAPPPEGELYARVRNEVFRITAAERRITARVDP